MEPLARATSTFEITGWEAAAPDGAAGTTLGRASVSKVFRGDLEGESVACVLTCHAGETPLGYLAQERIAGRLGGRSGTFVVQHGVPIGGEPPRALGTVVAGTGTGELVGLHGRLEYEHDAGGARCTLEYGFSEP
jgi:hypothetical protein